MSEQERRRFLLDTLRTAKLATVRPDGRPHVAPVWFDLDGDDFVFSTGERSVKGRNLIADPRLSICVDDERPPFAFVLVQGKAELSRDPVALREWAGRIGARYMGIDEADRLAELNGGPGNLLVRVISTHIVSENSITE
ncbi:MAG: PPOX class F420-dependent oxidoreductase [Pseudonocardiaceae bacterium]